MDETLPDVVVATDPEVPTTFLQLDGPGPARICLRQVSPTDFKLLEGFRYESGDDRWEVRPADLPDTDLASIPQLMGWFANSYGRHSLAALLHDHLVRNGERLDPPVPRHHADDVFLRSLDELGVPFVRSRIMWAAVVSATRWKQLRTSPAMALWSLAALVGIFVLVSSVLAGELMLLIAALVAPIPFAALWGRRDFRAGLVGGYTLWFLALPTIVNFVFYMLYAAAERVVQVCRRVRPPKDLPPPAGPPPFKDR